MDAVKFLDEKERLCDYYNCIDCPILNEFGLDITDITSEQFVSAVERWSIAHPQKTRAQDFFEKHPNAPKEEDGEPIACAKECGYTELCTKENGRYLTCIECWNEPMEVEE